MPEKIICGRCGFVFYEGHDLVPPEVIAKKYDYRCPRCSSPLKLKPLTIKIELGSNKRR